MSKMMSSVGKTLLRNHIRHTDTHNRLLEESDMWRQRRSRDGGRVRSTYEEMPRAHMDRREDTQPQQFQGREEASTSTYWVRQLYKAEEQDADRWGHGGYKELYPDDFDSDRSRESDDTERRKHKKKAKRKEKKEKKKKKHRKKEKDSSPDKKHRKKRRSRYSDEPRHSEKKPRSEWVEKSSSSSLNGRKSRRAADTDSDDIARTDSYKDVSSRNTSSPGHRTRNLRKKRQASESSDSSSGGQRTRKRRVFDGKSRHKRRRTNSTESSSD